MEINHQIFSIINQKINGKAGYFIQYLFIIVNLLVVVCVFTLFIEL